MAYALPRAPRAPPARPAHFLAAALPDVLALGGSSASVVACGPVIAPRARPAPLCCRSCQTAR